MDEPKTSMSALQPRTYVLRWFSNKQRRRSCDGTTEVLRKSHIAWPLCDRGNSRDNYHHTNTYMIRFMAGMVVGMYVGTTYDCKPYIDTIMKYVKDNFPEKR